MRLDIALAMLIPASVVSVALLAARAALFGSSAWMAWNLALAWTPFLVAVILRSSCARGHSRLVVVALGASWVVLLPNAPYILTDVVHVGGSSDSPVWYDAGVWAAFAATGLVLGFASVVIVQHLATTALSPGAGRAVLIAALLACTLGIYVGRVGRLNSWDALIQPDQIGRLLTIELYGSWMKDVPALLGTAGLLALTYILLHAVLGRLMIRDDVRS